MPRTPASRRIRRRRRPPSKAHQLNKTKRESQALPFLLPPQDSSKELIRNNIESRLTAKLPSLGDSHGLAQVPICRLPLRAEDPPAGPRRGPERPRGLERPRLSHEQDGAGH